MQLTRRRNDPGALFQVQNVEQVLRDSARVVRGSFDLTVDGYIGLSNSNRSWNYALELFRGVTD